MMKKKSRKKIRNELKRYVLQVFEELIIIVVVCHCFATAIFLSKSVSSLPFFFFLSVMSVLKSRERNRGGPPKKESHTYRIQSRLKPANHRCKISRCLTLSDYCFESCLFSGGLFWRKEELLSRRKAPKKDISFYINGLHLWPSLLDGEKCDAEAGKYSWLSELRSWYWIGDGTNK